jgi:hypothetical protein
VARRFALLLAFALLAVACSSGQSSSGTHHAVVSPEPTSDFTTAGWKTDFSMHSVPLMEILSGGPPRDGIPPLDHPRFVPSSAAASWLKGQEPVISLAVNGDRRAYPIQILIWHEIVNDQVGGKPVTVSFCPLCNTSIVFDRRVGGQTLDFGTTGNLRHSDLVMWDRQTESWWQQITGEAIVGQLTGSKLTLLPSSIVSFSAFRSAYPDGLVLSRQTGFDRRYGENPYIGYDDVNSSPFLYTGPSKDGRLPPKERVVTVSLGNEDVAYPFRVLQKKNAVNDSIGGTAVVVLWAPGTTSPLSSYDTAGPDIGAAAAFSPVVDGRRLTFSGSSGRFKDDQTGSQWDILGRAIAGPLAGRQLEPVLHGNHFWFAWAAFKPQTRVYA